MGFNYGPFADHNGVALPTEAAQAVAQKHASEGKTDDGTQPVAVPLEKAIEYFDPGLALDQTPFLARNTLQKAWAERNGYVTDRAEVNRRRLAAQAAKDAENR